jgi:hypothetical protein
VSDAGDTPPVSPDIDALVEALRESEGRRRTGDGPGTPLPDSTPAGDGLWHTTLQWVVAAAITAALAFFTYTREGWVPILSYFDLGVHEFGHLLAFWAPELIVWPAGSVLQVATPLALAAYFWHRRDRFAVILMIAWAAESLHNVSIYIADAQRMVLPLFGDDGSGAGHDWHNILGRLGWLESTAAIADFVSFLSIVLFALALALTGWWLVRSHRGSH